MRNTLVLNTLFIISGTLFAILLALSFNDLRGRFYKRVRQSITFLPYFISTVVIGVFVSGILAYETGSVTNLIEMITGVRPRFYQEPERWPLIMMIVNIWRMAGFNAIIYLAAISGIDPELYEAASIDGAKRVQQTWHITLPLLRPTIIVLTILAFGRIMNADFGLFFNVTRDVATLYPTMDVLDTYIFRALRQSGDIGISTATGLFQSIVAFFLVIICNKIANKIEPGSGLF
jgi:putative aldouronate transport system permease protein